MLQTLSPWKLVATVEKFYLWKNHLPPFRQVVCSNKFKCRNVGKALLPFNITRVLSGNTQVYKHKYALNSCSMLVCIHFQGYKDERCRAKKKKKRGSERETGGEREEIGREKKEKKRGNDYKLHGNCMPYIVEMDASFNEHEISLKQTNDHIRFSFKWFRHLSAFFSFIEKKNMRRFIFFI